MSAVSVIVPARDAEATLPATLKALAEQDPPVDHEVIVVDNGSHDRTASIAEAAGVRVIRRRRGEGPGSARNEGVCAAAGHVLAFTDSDCVPDARWLHEGVRATSRAALVQGRVEAVAPHGPFDRTLWVTWAWGLYETANLFVRREAFERVGGFGAGLEGANGAPFGEDTIFGWRIRRLGFEATFCDSAIVRHAVVPRSARAAIAEHLRDRYFPALVRAAPELRKVFLYRRTFLGRRRALLYPALAGAAWAGGRGDLRALALVAPYLRELVADADRVAPRSMRWTVAAALSAGDLVGAASSLRGSVEARTLVL